MFRDIKLNNTTVKKGIMSKKVTLKLSNGASIKYIKSESIIRQLLKNRTFIFFKKNVLKATRIPVIPIIP
jgi:hypothetical protein